MCREAILEGSQRNCGRGSVFTGISRGCGEVSPRFPEEPRGGGGVPGRRSRPRPAPSAEESGAVFPGEEGERRAQPACPAARGAGRAPWARPAAGMRSGCAAEGEPGGVRGDGTGGGRGIWGEAMAVWGGGGPAVR